MYQNLTHNISQFLNKKVNYVIAEKKKCVSFLCLPIIVSFFDDRFTKSLEFPGKNLYTLETSLHQTNDRLLKPSILSDYYIRALQITNQ